MNQEAVFLLGLVENPADDLLRLVYSDWLEERGDPDSLEKAEYLRLTVRSIGEKAGEMAARLEQLAAGLDPDWLAPVSRLAVENCPVERVHARRTFFSKLLFRKRCTRRWETLDPTSDPTVRHCDDCSQQVHYCGTIAKARAQAFFGNCIAVDLGIIRREGDVEKGRISMREPFEGEFLGMLLPSPELEQDPVSLERERKRLEKEADGA